MQYVADKIIILFKLRNRKDKKHYCEANDYPIIKSSGFKINIYICKLYEIKCQIIQFSLMVYSVLFEFFIKISVLA